jgi:hypothetical protein
LFCVTFPKEGKEEVTEWQNSIKATDVRGERSKKAYVRKLLD